MKGGMEGRTAKTGIETSMKNDTQRQKRPENPEKKERLQILGVHY